MRASLVALASALLLASAAGDVCPAPPSPPLPTPVPTPFLMVNPSGLCPMACPGYAAQPRLAAESFASFTTQKIPMPMSMNTTNILVSELGSGSSNTWPSMDAWYAGKYAMTFTSTDMCGKSASATATLDYRCNNPPMPMTFTQTVNVRYGVEVVLFGANSFDFDQYDQAALSFNWCLLSHPSSTGATITTQYESVESYLRVPTIPNLPAGYALFKPDFSGTYTFSVVVDDGCNYVASTFTVMATVTCCGQAATAAAPDVAIVWANQASTAYTATISAPVAPKSCLPADYIPSSARYSNTEMVYTNMYSPVYEGYGNMTVISNYIPMAGSPVAGCTWPGANNFDALATHDDGSCTCADLVNTFSMSPSMYSRRADVMAAAPVPVVKSAEALEFVTSLGSVTPMPATSCAQPSMSMTTMSAPVTVDIRVNSMSGIVSMPLLPRPSTSWDATVAYSITNTTTWTFMNSNATTVTVAQGETLCAVSLSSTSPADVTLSVAYGSGSSASQCLGYYTVQLASMANSVCPLSNDMVDVAVTCPYPSYVDILCDVSLLWDGTKFVKTPASTGATTNGWVEIDMRETPEAAGDVMWTLTMTKQPAQYYYLGADPSGPAFGMKDLNIAAVASLIPGSPMTAAFLPTRGGTYEVTLAANDGCNAPTFDSVVVTTQCLAITNLATIAPSPNPAANTYPVTIVANGTYTANAPSGNLNSMLNFAVRVVSRPTLPLGDAGMWTNPNLASDTSFECMTGSSFNTESATGPSVLTTATSPTIAAMLAVTGAYTLSVAVLDACSKTEAATSLTAPACGASVSGITFASPTAVQSTSTWSGATLGFPSITTPTLQNLPAGTTYYSWFLTKGTSGKVYNSTVNTVAALPASSVKCSAFAATWPTTNAAPSGTGGIGGLNALRVSSAADPWSPLAAPSSSASTFTFTPAAPGAYELSLQAFGACDVAVDPFPFNAVCNTPARFVCVAGGSCSAGNNPSGFSSPESMYNTVNRRYTRTAINVLADAGGDTFSNADILTFQVVVAAPSTSWWSAAYVTSSLTYSFMIPDDTADIFDDYTGFANIKAAVATAVQAAIIASSPVGSDASRVSLSLADLTTKLGATTPYASLAGATGLGVTLVPGCYTTGFGRWFTATVTFAVLPPVAFRSYGVVATAAAGYTRTLTPAMDYSPLSVFSANMFTPAMAMSLATASSTLAGYAGSMASPSFVPTFGTVASTPNTFIFQYSIATTNNVPTQATTLILPDIAGTYTANAFVWDNCPGASKTVSWTSNTNGFTAATSTLTVTQPSCSFSGLTTVMYDSSASLFSPSTSLSRTWTNSSTKFGSAWNYASTGPAYTPVTTFGAPVFACQAAGATACVPPTGTASSFTLPAAVQAWQLAAVPMIGGASFSNGMSITFTPGGAAASGVTAGSELLIGCAASASTYTPGNPAITFFSTVPTAFAGATTIVLPPSCLSLGTNAAIIFAQQASAGTTASAAWTITGLTVVAHAAGFSAVATSAVLSYSYTSGAYALPFNVSASSFPAQNLGNYYFASTAGYSSNLPSNQVSLATTFTVSYTFPSWVIATTCSASSTAPAVSLSCPVYTPSLSAIAPTFNASNFHFNPAGVMVSGVAVANPTTNVPVVYYPDVSFTFAVTSAPSGSVLDAATLIKGPLYTLVMTEFGARFTGSNPVGTTNNPLPGILDVECHSKEEVTLMPLTGLKSSMCNFNSQINTTFQSYINITSLKIMLAPTAVPSDFSYIATPLKNGAYWSYYLGQTGMAQFMPDVAGTYGVSATVNDMCNPVSMLSTTVVTGACPVPVLVVKQLGTPAAITNSGAGRVFLAGTVNGAAFLGDARVLKVMWTVTGPTGMPAMVYDADSLYPSFLPNMAGEYSVSFMVNVGTSCPIAPATYKVNVACTATPAAPMAAVSMSNYYTSVSLQRTSSNGLLTVAYTPNAYGGFNRNKDTMYWIGQPGCPVQGSFWNAPSTVSYTCPSATYSVAVTGVYPSMLLAGVPVQVVTVMVTVGGVAAIPAGLMNAMWGDDPSLAAALSITVDGQTCSNAMVANAATGMLVCELLNAQSLSSPSKVSVTLDRVSSADIHKDGMVGFSTMPTITSAGRTSSGAAGVLGGDRVGVWGVNLVPSGMFSGAWMWSAADTMVWIDGKACTGVQAAGSDVMGMQQQYLTCIAPAGYGANLEVRVQVGFRDMQTNMLVQSSVGTAFVFSYDAPSVQSITPALGAPVLGSGQGGAWYTATIKNFGMPMLNTFMPSASGQAMPSMYSDVFLMLGTSPVASFKVTVAESASAPASVMFQLPEGCGANLDLTVYRRNAMSMPSSVKFSYAQPVVTCIGQPFVDPTSSACTRVYIEGTNFGNHDNATSVVIGFYSGATMVGMCDNVQFERSSDYVRASCRLPSTAGPGNTVMVTNECGQQSTSPVSLGAAAGLGAAPGLPASINLAGCGTAFSVANGAPFNYAINAPVQPATEVRKESVMIVELTQGGEWKDQILSNGLFIGLVFPVLLLAVIVYPIFAFLQKRKA